MRKRMKSFLHTLCALALFACNSTSAFAQCAMCRASVQTGGSASAFSEPLNIAILVLLIPPALIFCAIFLLLIRYRKTVYERPNVKPFATREAFD